MNACSVLGFWSHLQMARFVATCSLSSTLCNASLPTAAAAPPPRPSPHAPPHISGLPTLTSQPPPWRGAWGRRAAALGGGALVSQAALHTLFCGFHPTATKCLASASVKEKSIHDFTVKDISGKSVDLSIFKGKLLLVVNVASQCGLTAGNYAELSELHKKYRDEGFEILAFPCNQFGGQEPGTNEQIKEFACSRYKAEFPIFDKVDVNGPSTAPVYVFLKASKGGLLGDSIKWNFGKFLVDKNGQVVERYAPTTSPLQIESDIKKLLFAK